MLDGLSASAKLMAVSQDKNTSCTIIYGKIGPNAENMLA